MLPALERFIVVVSRLRGLSKFQVSNVTLGLSTQELNNVMDTVESLQLVAHRILITAGKEFRQFQAFAVWLRQEIDLQATEASSSETGDRDVSIDHANTLEYINGPMMQSQLTQLFGLDQQSDDSSQWDLAAEGRSLFELYKREYGNTGSKIFSAKRLPGLDALIQHLKSQCEVVFERIAQTQRRNVRFGPSVSLGAGSPTCMDIKTLVEVGPPKHEMSRILRL